VQTTGWAPRRCGFRSSQSTFVQRSWATRHSSGDRASAIALIIALVAGGLFVCASALLYPITIYDGSKYNWVWQLNATD
jgi:hypothetical protein